MPDVFISYSSKDSEIAHAIYNKLVVEGIETYVAEISIEPGKVWKYDFKKNLRKSKFVFFIATQNSIQSAFVHNELGVADDRQKQIIPILIDVNHEELPGVSSDYQALDLRGKNIDDIDPLVKRIAEKLLTKDIVKFGIIAFLIGVAIKPFFEDDS